MMVIRIGRIIGFLLTLFTCVYAVDSIELQLTDLNGKPMNHIGVGESAIVRVRITGSLGSSISIPGLEDFYHEQRGSYKTMYSINGKQTNTIDHEYFIRAQSTGIFKLGPIEIDGIKSNKLIVKVKPRVTRHRNSTDEVTLECTPKIVYGVPGQKIELSLSIDAAEPVQNIQLQPPQVKKDLFSISNMRKIKEAIRVVNGKKHKVIECTVDLVVHKAGRWLLPEFSCIAQLPRNSRVFGPLISQIGFGMQEKIFYANPVQVIVELLPDTDERIDGIGEFTSFTAVLDKTEVNEGEGCILTLNIVGKGNFEAIAPLSLVLPDGLKYYESRTELDADGQEVSKKFEYVLQGTQPGNMTIEPQLFRYFDSSEKLIKTLATDPLNLTVIGLKTENTYKTKTATGPGDQQQLQLNEHGPWYPRSERSIPTRLFILLTLIPLMLFIGVAGYRLWNSYYIYHYAYYRRKNAYKNAKKRLAKIKKHKKTQELYDLFMTYFSDKFDMAKSVCSQSVIEERLLAAGMGDDGLEQWHSFWYYLNACSYGNESQQDFFERAEVWLSQLEDVL